MVPGSTAGNVGLVGDWQEKFTKMSPQTLQCFLQYVCINYKILSEYIKIK